MNCHFQLISDSVSDVNEDEVGFNHHEGWILDGATSLSGRRQDVDGRQESDASWFVRKFSDGLRRRPMEQPVSSWARTVLRDIESVTHAEWGDWSNIDVPSASYAHVQLQRGFLKLHNLGDCRVLYRIDGGPVLSFGSSTVNHLDENLLRIYRDFRAGSPSLSHQQAWTRLIPIIRANRQLMNRPGGYWILSPDGKGMDYIQCAEIDFRYKFQLMLMTDGLSRLSDTYFQLSSESIFYRAFELDGLTTLIRDLRSLENADFDADRYPRVKLQDDASALLISACIDETLPAT